ncbi:MAG: CHAD domain-containing protein, partial [Actinomycetota bacterium]
MSNVAHLPEELLGRPATQSVRLIAQHYLDDAVAALARIEDPEDTEALHDLRVALRRLRSTLRAYRDQLQGSMRRKLRRRLRDIAEETNRIREAEVALDWLRPLAPQLNGHERVGLRWLMERIEQQRADHLKRSLADVRRSFTTAEQGLRKGLAVYRQKVRSDRSAPEESFPSVARVALLQHAERLDRLLEAVQGMEDEALHRARIAAKRLRYLLEPLALVLPGGIALVERLKSLQDVLGELHDLFEFEDEVRQAAAAAGAQRAGRLLDVALADDPTEDDLKASRRRGYNPGLAAIGRRLRARRSALYAELSTKWLGGDRVWSRAIEATAEPLATP